MSVVEKSIEVDVPVTTAYDQWTQFEEFPRFMEGVERVEQLDDATLRWSVEIAGVDRSFETRITDQEPDRRIRWSTTEGQQHEGEVRFEADNGRTRIYLSMAYEPEDWTDKVGDFLNVIDWRVQKDLEQFKEFIESRGQETGAWRGEIEEGRPRSTDPDPTNAPSDEMPGSTGQR